MQDGDSLTLLVPDGTRYQQVKVRLGEIDTPESKQPYGSRARQALSDLAFGKPARVVVQDTDKYGRTVGRVYVGSVDVNAEMIRQGAAWAYRQYLKDQSLLKLEADAKAAKRGLWGLPEAHRCPPPGTGARMRAQRQPQRQPHRLLVRRQPPPAVLPAPASDVAGK